MIVFWSLAALIMVTSAWVIYRVATGKQSGNAQDSESLRISLFRENIEELESELQTGDLDTSQLENVRSELELSLLAEVAPDVPREVGEQADNHMQKFC